MAKKGLQANARIDNVASGQSECVCLGRCLVSISTQFPVHSCYHRLYIHRRFCFKLTRRFVFTMRLSFGISSNSNLKDCYHPHCPYQPFLPHLPCRQPKSRHSSLPESRGCMRKLRRLLHPCPTRRFAVGSRVRNVRTRPID